MNYSLNSTTNNILSGLLNLIKLNNDIDYKSRNQSLSIYFKLIVTIIYTVILILSLGGNVLIILIIKARKIGTVTDFFIVNLAICDIIFVSLCIPSTYMSYIYTNQWLLGKVCNKKKKKFKIRFIQYNFLFLDCVSPIELFTECLSYIDCLYIIINDNRKVHWYHSTFE
jgi:hypothetical protein